MVCLSSARCVQSAPESSEIFNIIKLSCSKHEPTAAITAYSKLEIKYRQIKILIIIIIIIAIRFSSKTVEYTRIGVEYLYMSFDIIKKNQFAFGLPLIGFVFKPYATYKNKTSKTYPFIIKVIIIHG